VKKLLVLAVATASCSRAITQHNVDEPARRLECPGEPAVPSTWTSPARQVDYVPLELVVDSTGRVDPESIFYTVGSDPRQRIPDAVVAAAKAIAAQCRYAPAHHQGKLVPIRVKERFAVLIGE
jgi:hypothetical protein